MARKRRARRSVSRVLMAWLGGALIRRVQRGSLKGFGAAPRRRGPLSSTITRAARRLPAGRVLGRGVAMAALSGLAVTALKYGVERVVEAERARPLVTPDFDVFNDEQ